MGEVKHWSNTDRGSASSPLPVLSGHDSPAEGAVTAHPHLGHKDILSQSRGLFSHNSILLSQSSLLLSSDCCLHERPALALITEFFYFLLSGLCSLNILLYYFVCQLQLTVNIVPGVQYPGLFLVLLIFSPVAEVQFQITCSVALCSIAWSSSRSC